MSGDQEDRRSEAERWFLVFLETTRMAKDFGSITIQSLILINGGAIVALLTFLGGSDLTLEQRRFLTDKNFGDVFIFFAVGLSAAIFASGMGYLNYSLINQSLPSPYKLRKYITDNDVSGWQRHNYAIGITFLFAVLSVIFSLLSFVIGAYRAQSLIIGAV